MKDEVTKENGGKFKISSSKCASETFLPHFYEDPDTGIVFADVAGLKDTGTSIIKILNCFILLFIFRKAATVRFLMAVPYTKFGSRTLTVRNDFEAIQ